MGTKGYWLNERRLLVYSRLCVAIYVVGLLSWLTARVWLAEAPITTLRNDFAGLWSVAHMVLQGRASEAYLPDLALAAEAAFVPEHEVRLPWFYPPPVFALIAPLAALPYKIASDKPTAWVSLDQALTAFKNGQGFDGIGLMLKDLKGYAFLDLDDCRDPDTGGAVSWAQQMIDQASSYTELTPSGTGFRIIGTVPEDFRHMHTTVQRGAGHVEIYANSTTGRYATITGAKLDGSPDALADLSALIDDLQPLPSKEEGAFDFNAAPRQYSQYDGCKGYDIDRLPPWMQRDIVEGWPEGTVDRSGKFAALVWKLHDDLRWPLNAVVRLFEHHSSGAAAKYTGRIRQEVERLWRKPAPGGSEVRTAQPDTENILGDPFGQFDAPELPRGVLPAVIEAFAERISVVMGVDPAGPAMAALTVCAAALPDHVCVRVKVHEDWFESARLWVALIGSPSTKKSPIMRRAMGPLKRLESRKMAAWLAERDAWEKLDKDGRGELPPCPQSIVNDTTIEACGLVMADNHQGLLLERDELSGWFGQMDRYASNRSGSADRSFWLQAHNGGSYRVNRTSRKSLYIPNLSVSIIGGIQPSAIKEVAGHTVDDGLIQRLVPIFLGPASIGEDYPDRDHAERKFGDLVERLTAFTEQTVKFTADAQTIRREFETYAHKLTMLEALSPQLGAFCGKLPGLFPRLALLLHACDTSARDIPEHITAETAKRVDRMLREFIIPHAKKFYFDTITETGPMADARSIAGWILAHEKTRFTMRDLHREVAACRKQPRKVIEEMLEPLELMGWLKRDNEMIPRAWTVDPRVHATFAETAASERIRRKQVRELITDEVEQRRRAKEDET